MAQPTSHGKNAFLSHLSRIGSLDLVKPHWDLPIIRVTPTQEVNSCRQRCPRHVRRHGIGCPTSPPIPRHSPSAGERNDKSNGASIKERCCFHTSSSLFLSTPYLSIELDTHKRHEECWRNVDHPHEDTKTMGVQDQQKQWVSRITRITEVCPPRRGGTLGGPSLLFGWAVTTEARWWTARNTKTSSGTSYHPRARSGPRPRAGASPVGRREKLKQQPREPYKPGSRDASHCRSYLGLLLLENAPRGLQEESPGCSTPVRNRENPSPARRLSRRAPGTSGEAQRPPGPSATPARNRARPEPAGRRRAAEHPCQTA